MIIEQLLEELDSQPITMVCSTCQGSGQILSYKWNTFRLQAAPDKELIANQESTLSELALPIEASADICQCPDCVCGVCLTEHGRKVAQLYTKLKQTEFIEFSAMVE